MTVPAKGRVAAVAKQAAVTINKVETKMNSRSMLVSFIITTALIFVTLIGFNYLAARPSISGGLFSFTIGEISDMFPVNISPAAWAFSIWGLIYLLVASWQLYNLALICRVLPDGLPAYLSPTILTPSFLFFFNLSSIFNIAWLFMWDRMLFLASFVFLVCIAISLSLSWAIVGYRLPIYKNFLIDQGRKLEVRFIYLAVLNGVAMYATWTTIATLINLNIVLVYKLGSGLDPEVASIATLAVLAVIILVFVPLDLSVLDRYNRFVVAPYFTVVWAAAAIMNANWNPMATSSIMSVVILGAATLATLSKVTLMVARSRNENYRYKQMSAGN